MSTTPLKASTRLKTMMAAILLAAIVACGGGGNDASKPSDAPHENASNDTSSGMLEMADNLVRQISGAAASAVFASTIF